MLQDLINKRKSVRKYINKPIPREALLKCVEAARLAPSACNAQPWKFIIVNEPSLKDRLCEEAFRGIYSINEFAKSAPCLIIVVSEKETFVRSMGGYIRGTDYCLLDIGISTEHLVLAATELGIGTCWIGWFDERPVKKILGIPRKKKVDVIITMGYYSEDNAQPKKRKLLEETSSFNKYK